MIVPRATTRWLAVACTLAAAVSPAPAALAQPMAGGGGMPNLRRISGKALPDSGMAPGTVSVRLGKQTPANAVANTEVTAIVEGPDGESRKRSAKTDSGGRALFEGIRPGHRFHAEVTVDGERLVTDTFTIPERGGIRTMLIAGLGAAPAGGEDETPEADGEQRQPFRLGFVAATPRPDPTVPAGVVEVVALDENGRPLVGKNIELGYIRTGGKVEVAREVTDSRGVVRFTGFAPVPTASEGGPGGQGGRAGTTGEVAAAVVMQHGEMRVGSDGFSIPATQGVKIEMRVPHRSADPSLISIGPGGRVILQLRDDNVGFIETLPLENHTDQIYDPGPGGIEIPLPTEFSNPDTAQSEHKLEIRKGLGIAVHGLIPPKRPQAADPNFKSPDEITFGFLLPNTGSSRDFEQRFPNGLGEFTFITDQIPGLTVESTQISGRQDRELNGKKYWLMRGEPIPPGGTLRFTLHGLPAPDTTGRLIALALALGLVGAAIWFGRRRQGTKGPDLVAERDRLVQRREKLFTELVGLETREVGSRDGREDLVQKLATVYREIAALDERRAV